MPLDPVFAERVRANRRHILRRIRAEVLGALRSAAGAVGGVFRRDGRTGSIPANQTAPPAHATPAHQHQLGRSTPISPRTLVDDSPVRDARSAWQRLRERRAQRASERRRQNRRDARSWDARELAAVGAPGPDHVRTRDVRIPVRGFPEVLVRIYNPRPASQTSSLPAFITFFGGSFTVGGIDYPTNDAAARRRAAAANVVLIAVDYALAPEHPFPAAVRQGLTVLEWVHAQHADLGVTPDAIAIGGVSAGAGIAAAVTVANRHGQDLPLAHQVLEVPALDLTARYIDLGPVVRMGIPITLVLAQLIAVARTYLPRLSLAKHPLASPLRARSFAGLPAATILTAEYDLLRRHGPAYASRLRDAGVSASCVQYAGATHDIPFFVGAVPAAARWDADVISVLRALHQQLPPTPE